MVLWANEDKRHITWEVSMDGMSDARGSLQGDVVQKHGSLSVASPQCSSGAANRALRPAQNYWEIKENKEIYRYISVNAVNTTNVLSFTGARQSSEGLREIFKLNCTVV